MLLRKTQHGFSYSYQLWPGQRDFSDQEMINAPIDKGQGDQYLKIGDSIFIQKKLRQDYGGCIIA